MVLYTANGCRQLYEVLSSVANVWPPLTSSGLPVHTVEGLRSDNAPPGWRICLDGPLITTDNLCPAHTET